MEWFSGRQTLPAIAYMGRRPIWMVGGIRLPIPDISCQAMLCNPSGISNDSQSWRVSAGQSRRSLALLVLLLPMDLLFFSSFFLLALEGPHIISGGAISGMEWFSGWQTLLVIAYMGRRPI